MNTYKITNITNLLAKRDRKANTTLAIEYSDRMIKKTINVKPNDTVFLTVSTLPLSVHRLRIKNLISVTEVNPAEAVKASQKAKSPKKKDIPKPKAVKKPVVVVEEKEPVLAEDISEPEITPKSTQKKGRPAKKTTTE